MKCRFCGTEATQTVVDLGMQPLSNAYVPSSAADSMEPFYPLHVRVCGQCFLVQLPELQSPESIFTDYAYLSSMSDSWLEHARAYVDAMVPRFKLGASSLVVEVASNDGYLLQYFKGHGVPVLGIEPAANVAKIAVEKGVPSLSEFFGAALARRLVAEGKRADLLLGNNVLAHVPDINDFVAGLSILLAPNGVLTMEFPHLADLMDHNQFDTIYHEHFSYLSLSVVQRVFEKAGLEVFDVDELPTHGGSLRVYARHRANGSLAATERVAKVLEEERSKGLETLEGYRAFAARVAETKRTLLEFLIRCKRGDKRVVGYGAAAKGNTLLNYCGIRTDFVDAVADRSPFKQGKLLPGTHIPVVPPEAIREMRPDYVLILPWNIQTEVAKQLSFIEEWGGRFVVAIPTLTVLS